MIKAELIKAVASKANLINQKTASQAVNAVFEVIADALKKGEEVRITGFGTFKVVHRASREGRNPQTGEKISIPARKVVRFKPGKDLRF